MKARGKKWLIGIDEVGRGALAGPLTVGIVAMPAGSAFRNVPAPLRDSKKLTALQREAWVRYLRAEQKNGREIIFKTVSVSPKTVDRLNVTGAANHAATKALTKVLCESGIAPRTARVFLDGGLYINRQPQIKFPKAKTIIKGDEKIRVVALASIVAKVTRDRTLTKLDATYPEYRFAVHKGYGTRVHIKAVRRYGISDVHRLTFTKKWATL